MLKPILVLLLALPLATFASVDELPALGIKAVYDSATGFVEITQAGVATVIQENVGTGTANSKLLSDVDQSGVILYEKNGTALILKTAPGALTLFSKTFLPLSAWPGVNVVGEGFRFLNSPGGKISVALFRQSYHQLIGGSRVTSFLRTVVSNLTDTCVLDLDKSLLAPNVVDQNWSRAAAVVQDLIDTREDECAAAASFGFSLPKL